MQLPYTFTDDPNWVAMVFGAGTQVGLRDYRHERDRRVANGILEALIRDAGAADALGACLVTSSAHSYTVQDLAVQTAPSQFVVQSWSDVRRTVTAPWAVALDLDIPTELRQLREDGLELRSGHNHNPDLQSGTEGRFGTVYLVAGTDGDWVTCPRLLRGGIYPNIAINRVYRAIGRLDQQVQLRSPEDAGPRSKHRPMKRWRRW